MRKEATAGKVLPMGRELIIPALAGELGVTQQQLINALMSQVDEHTDYPLSDSRIIWEDGAGADVTFQTHDNANPFRTWVFDSSVYDLFVDEITFGVEGVGVEGAYVRVEIDGILQDGKTWECILDEGGKQVVPFGRMASSAYQIRTYAEGLGAGITVKCSLSAMGEVVNYKLLEGRRARLASEQGQDTTQGYRAIASMVQKGSAATVKSAVTGLQSAGLLGSSSSSTTQTASRSTTKTATRR